VTYTPHDEADVGLLSPVRAGTPVAAAVGDRAWLQAMLDAESALVRARARLGTVPAAAARAITDAARANRFDLPGLARDARESANPVVCLVEALTEVASEESPAAAEYVHRGSTSQDILDTASMLVASRALRLVSGDLRRTADALGRTAQAHRDSPMAGRTLALHAVPTTFGLKAVGWRQLVLEASTRVDRLLDGGLPVALGGAAGTLAGYLEYAGIDRPGLRDAEAAAHYRRELTRIFAEELGLSNTVLPWHSLRTPVADLAAVLAYTAGEVGNIAVDVLSLARTEVAEVAEPAAVGRGTSSAMPHKRNPVLATLIRSAALQVPGLRAGLSQCMLSEDERSAGAWHAEWQLLRECLRLAGRAAHTAAELSEGLVVNSERMRANLLMTGSRMLSERLAAVLAPRLGKSAARILLDHASAQAEQTGRPLGQVLADHREIDGLLPSAELTALLDPAGYTGAGGALVDDALGAAGGPSTGPGAPRARWTAPETRMQTQKTRAQFLRTHINPVPTRGCITMSLTVPALKDGGLTMGPVDDPRESMRVLPRFLQYPLTLLTGKPLAGQKPIPWWTPTFHLVAAFTNLLVGIGLGVTGWAASGGWLMLLLPAWAVILHAMRNLRMMIFHQCSHRNMYRRRIDTVIGGAIASLLIVQNYRRYSREHVSDHHASHHMTLRDPTVQAILISLDLHPGMTRRQMYRRVTRKVLSPYFHLSFARGRMLSFWIGAMPGERTAAVLLYGGTLTATIATGTWPAFLVIWCVPLLPLFQVVNITRLCVKHRFPAPGVTDKRGKEYFGSLTNAVFMGEAAPPATLPPVVRTVAWARWTLRMLLVHAPLRYMVITADTPVHDWHHRHPSAKNWANYFFARQADIDDGSPGWPPYSSAWGLVSAINVVFDSIARADRSEFDVSRIRDVSKRDLFAAFDD
jgi:3-carboxy-cis,cis-muconate cycloisomerase